MNDGEHLDFTRLAGFAQVADEARDTVDFRDDAFGAKLGAKIGDGEAAEPRAAES